MTLIERPKKINKINETFSAGQWARFEDLSGRNGKVNIEIAEKRRAHAVEDGKRIIEFMKDRGCGLVPEIQ